MEAPFGLNPSSVNSAERVAFEASDTGYMTVMKRAASCADFLRVTVYPLRATDS